MRALTRMSCIVVGVAASEKSLLTTTQDTRHVHTSMKVAFGGGSLEITEI